MKKYILCAALAACLCVVASPTAFGVSKETIQMMQQLDTLTQMVQSMQKTLDTQTAVLKTLVEQANDNVNAMRNTVSDLQKKEEQNLASTGNRFDSMTGQVQALGESLDESKARIAKLSDQLAQIQKTIETLNAPPQNNAPGTTLNPGTPGQPGQPGPGANNKPPAPDPDTLYKSAYTDYTTGQYSLAVQEFQEYLQLYGDTDLASNAQFYVGDAYYNQQNYKQAITEYNKCLEQYPDGNKTAAAQLKKGFALVALGQTAAGRRELQSVVRRYPHSHEADLAREHLHRLASAASRQRG